MPERAELWRKTGRRGLLIASYKRLEKDFDRAITPAVEAVPVPTHLAPPGSLQAKQLNHLHTKVSLSRVRVVLVDIIFGFLCLLGQFFSLDRASTSKKCFVPVHVGSLHECLTLCDPVDCGLPGFSVREGGSPGRNTGAYWPILVAIPFWSTIFPAALASNPLEYLMLPEPL